MTIHFADGSTIAAGGAFGKVVQVVSHVKTDTSSFSVGSGSKHHDTNFAASITPSSSSNKVMVIIQVNHGTSSNHVASASLMRGSSVINEARGASSGSRARVSISYHGEETMMFTTVPLMFLDSPSTTSSTTYSLEWEHNSSSTREQYINRGEQDNNASGNGAGFRGASSILLLEIAA